MTKNYTIFEFGSQKIFGKDKKRGREIKTFEDVDEAVRYINSEYNFPVTAKVLDSYGPSEATSGILTFPDGKHGLDVYWVMG